VIRRVPRRSFAYGCATYRENMDHPDSTAAPASAPSARLTLTVPEVAVALGISRNHAYWMIARGVIPSKRLGRRYLVGRSALETWLAANNR
jgi:excisionase family DNA binding protein